MNLPVSLESTGMASLLVGRCGSCKHWHSVSGTAGPNNRPAGECRESVHSHVIQNRQGQPQVITYYPAIPDDHQPCSHFERRQEVV